MQIIKISVGDSLLMKKNHPCGFNTFSVLRVGSDIRIKCDGCGRDMTLPRESVEKMIKRVVSPQGDSADNRG